MSLKLSKNLFSILLLLGVFCLSIGVVSASELHGPNSVTKSVDGVNSVIVDDSVSSVSVESVDGHVGSNLEGVNSNLNGVSEVSTKKSTDDSTFDLKKLSLTSEELYKNFNTKNCSWNVYSEGDFKMLFDYLKSSSNVPDQVNINIVNDINVRGSNIMSVNFKNTIFNINGNGHSIKVDNPKDNAENHFLTCGSNGKVFMNNLTLSGFNTAIVNHGEVNLVSVTFDKNRIDYMFKEDFGGAIWSDGKLNAYSCLFKDNYAKWGGAIYLKNTDATRVEMCCFEGNDQYGWHPRGNDIYGGKNVNTVIINSDIVHDWCKWGGAPNVLLKEGLEKYLKTQ